MRIRCTLAWLITAVVAADVAVQAQTNTFPATGNVGIGITTPNAPLSIFANSLGTTAGSTLNLLALQNTNANWNYLNIFQFRNSNGVYWTTATTRIQQGTDATNQGYMDFNPINGPYGLAFGSGGTEFMRMTGNGSVGIGTTAPHTPLEVNGSVTLSAGSGASITFPDGTVQATAWNGTTLGGDYAESVDVQGSRATYEPGDVIAIDDAESGKFSKSNKAYSKLVAGVYSTKPGLVGRRTTFARVDKDAEVPMAMTGIVPTKVTAENGPVERGDLLVTSSTPGYAMKATDPSRTMGAVIGKALAPLKAGSGIIEVLIALQ